MNIIKRNGTEVEFDIARIIQAVTKANEQTKKTFPNAGTLSKNQILVIAEQVEDAIKNMAYAPQVEEIQSLVITAINRQQAYTVAQLYTEYKFKRDLARHKNTTDDAIFTLIEYQNEEIKQENSNKNPMISPTQRDYIAGEVSKDLTMRVLLPSDVVAEHENGNAHFHDADYFIQKIHNCDLINLEDMLQNGTVISEVQITKPHSLATAANLTCQIITQVSSSQYGGQTFTLSHLAPFVDVSRRKIREEVLRELELLVQPCSADGRKPVQMEMPKGKEEFYEGKEHILGYFHITPASIEGIVEKRLAKEVRAAIQTIQYQLVTMMTTNGQTPFISMFICLDEVPEGQLRDDLAMLTEEVLLQRTKGLPNEKGHWVTTAFPKLLYAMDEDNAYPGSKYYHLTELAAKCISKQMVPDLISVKKMKELKGDVYPCMGCVDGKSVIDYRLDGKRYVESFERAWTRLSFVYDIKFQENGIDLFMDTPGVEIYDCKEKRYVKQFRMIRNAQDSWRRICFTRGRYLDVTDDHPFEIIGKGVIPAMDLEIGDKTYRQTAENVTAAPNDSFNDKMWLLGLISCDGCYDRQMNIALGMDEKDVAGFAESAFKAIGYTAKTEEQHRGRKGDYIEVRVPGSEPLQQWCLSCFEGKRKIKRHIPQFIFNMPYAERMSFLAGMIDADGSVNNSGNTLKIQIGSTNEELALQEMLLAESLGLNAAIYLNHYKKGSGEIRYRVEFNATSDIIKYLTSGKKKSKFKGTHTFYENTALSDGICSVLSITPYTEPKFSYDVTTESEHFTVNGVYSHNCRSFLTPDRFTDSGVGNIANAMNYEPGKHKYYGRFNQGVYTLNLVAIACQSGRDMEKFWEIFDEKLEIAHKALRSRHNRLLGTPSDVAPILWQFGALARLEKGEPIDRLLYDGYSTISLGYAGLYECCMYMTGKSHTNEEAKPFAIKVMQHLNDACSKWKAKENIDYSLYGTPLESTTYKFAKALQKQYGIIKDVTDHNYITNSYHVNVREEIDAFTKLKFEAEFQALSPGGAISYVEVPNMQDNIPAVLTLMQYIYENIMYAELNTKSDYCQACGYDGEIKIIEDKGQKLIWECPNCGNRDQNKMNIARRTCGYIGTQFWNQGRTQEIRDRVLHL